MTGSKSQNLDSLAYPYYYNMPGVFNFHSVCLWPFGIMSVFMAKKKMLKEPALTVNPGDLTAFSSDLD
jgi:hypothetical protein